MTTYKLTDEAISHVAKTLQIALLTGTDIVDNLRTIRLVSNREGELALDPDYSEHFDKNIQGMLEKSATLEKEKVLAEAGFGRPAIDLGIPGLNNLQIGLVPDKNEDE